MISQEFAAVIWMQFAHAERGRRDDERRVAFVEGQARRPVSEGRSERVWDWAKIVLVGAMLAPGKRTVTACVRVLGLSHAQHFQAYHRVLNRASWSSRTVSRVLLGLLRHAFVPGDAPIALGIDAPLERRRGRKIAAKGLDRDSVRVSTSFFVTSRSVRWGCLIVLAPSPWAKWV